MRENAARARSDGSWRERLHAINHAACLRTGPIYMTVMLLLTGAMVALLMRALGWRAIAGLVVVPLLVALLSGWARGRGVRVPLLSAATAALWLFVPWARLGATIAWLGLVSIGFERRPRWPGLAALVLSPCLAIAASAAVDYAHGDARIWGFGLMAGPGSLDLECRAYHASRGCMVRPTEATVIHPVHNATVCALTRLLGPMPGAYAGPYPTAAEAMVTIETSGIAVSAEEVWGDPPRLPSALTTDLAEGGGGLDEEDLRRGLGRAFFFAEDFELAIFEDEVLLAATRADDGSIDRIAVTTLSKGEYLTTYGSWDLHPGP